MGLAILELIQKDNGEIILQAEEGDEPLLQLRFSRKLTDILGADALSLAQAMVESAGYAFEYAHEAVARDAVGQRAGLDLAATELLEEQERDAEESQDAMVRLRTTPLH